MKTFRLFAALLVVALFTAPAFSQESGEIASLLTKARKGNGIAQYNLGLAYADGKGVAADPVEAFVWLTLARENGARGRALDTLMGALDKQSLDLAQQRLIDRKAELGVRTATPVTVRTTTTAKESPPKTATVAEAPAAAKTEESLAKVQAERDALRAERERLIDASAEHEKAARAATAANQALQDQAKAAEARAAEFSRATETAKGELARAKLALVAAQKAAKPAAIDPSVQAELEQAKKELDRTKLALAASLAAPKPAPDTAALDQKTRELQAALTELESAKAFGRQVEDTLNKVNDDKARVAATAAAELAEARAFGSQVENTLNKVSDQKTALEATLRAAEAARDGYAREFAAAKSQLDATKSAAPAAPAYPNLSGKVADLESQLAQANEALKAKPAAPSYPDLRSRVTELETKLTTTEKSLAAKPSAPAYPDLRSNNSALEAKVSALTAENNKANLQAASFLTAMGDQSATIKQSAADLAAAKSQVATLEVALAAKPAAPAYPDLSAKVAELQSANSAVSTSLARASAEADRAKQETVALTKARDEAVAALAVKAAAPAAPAYPNLSGKVAELESALANATQKTTATEQARAELVKQFDDYKGATVAAQREHTTLLASMKMLESDKASLRRQVESAGADAGQLRTQVATLKEQLAAKPAAVPAYPDLRSRVTNLEADLVTAKQLLAAKSSAPVYPDLAPKVAELETALRNSTQQLAAASTDADRAHREIVLLNQSLADAPKTATPTYPDYTGLVKDLTSEVTKLRADRAQLQQSLGATERQAGELATSTSRAKELEAQVGNLQAALAIKPVSPSFPDLRERVATLEHDLTAARNAAPAYPDLSGRVNELQTQLAAKASDLSNATSAKAAADQQVAVLNKALAEKSSAPVYPDLSGRVAALETQLARASTDLSAATSAKMEALASVAVLTKTNAAAKAAAPAYPDLSGRVSELEAALAAKPAAPAYPDLSGKVSELQTMLVDSAGKQAASEREQVELRQQLAAAQESAKTKGSAETQLQREHQELTGRVTLLNSEVAQLRDDRERMQKMLGDAGRKLRDSSADASRIKELETQAAGLQASLAAAQAQTGELQAALSAKPVSLSFPDLRERVAALERDLAAAHASAPAYPDLSAKVTELEAALAARPAAPTYPDLSGRVTELEAQLAKAREPIAAGAPAYPDLSDRVTELEGQLARARQTAAAKPSAPAYPDLSGRVAELETALTAARLNPAPGQPAATEAAPTTDTSALEKRLAETEDRLATALRGYALLEKDRDAQQTKSGQANTALASEKSSLAEQVSALSAQVEQLKSTGAASASAASAENARLADSLAALQRSSGQTAGDAAANRALVQQLQGTNSVLAQENYQLKATLARNTGAATPTRPTAVLVSPPAARMHVVIAGDSLSKISQLYYGNVNRWQEIYNANAGKLGPNGVLRVGTELRIP